METHPKKSLGQNFLVNPHILDKIVVSARISKDDIVIEVGPGTGNLTKKLAEKAKKVIAIEKDRRLIKDLVEIFGDNPNVEILEADILKFKIEDLKLGSYKIVANIPYYITSHFLRTVFESASWRITQPNLIVLTIQKEVAQQIMAKPPHMNLLALSVQYYSQPEIISYISKNNFRPIPKVDSAIIRLRPYNVRDDSTALLRYNLFRLIKIGFSEKRKILSSTLARKLHLSKGGVMLVFKKSNIDSKSRPENLSLNDWQRLASEL